LHGLLSRFGPFADELWDSFKAQLPGTTQDHLQIFNIEMKAKMKSYQMPEQVLAFLIFLRTSRDLLFDGWYYFPLVL
jgi:hypothetical protein